MGVFYCTCGAPVGVTGESSTPQDRFFKRWALGPPNSFARSFSWQSCRSLTVTTPRAWSLLAVWWPTPATFIRGNTQVGNRERRSKFNMPTRNFSETAERSHNVANILRQQGGLLVGLEGPWHQLGQQLIGGDASAAGQTHLIVDGFSELCCNVRSHRQPCTITSFHFCTRARKGKQQWQQADK